MVNIIRLTGAGHEEHKGLSTAEARKTLTKLQYERYLLVDWRTNEVIEPADLEEAMEDEDATIALVPQVAGGSQSAFPLFLKPKPNTSGGARRQRKVVAELWENVREGRGMRR